MILGACCKVLADWRYNELERSSSYEEASEWIDTPSLLVDFEFCFLEGLLMCDGLLRGADFLVSGLFCSKYD